MAEVTQTVEEKKEAAEEYAKTLTKQLGKKVDAFAFEVSEDDVCIGYVLEPSRQAKIAGLGLIMTMYSGTNDAGMIDGGMQILASCLIIDQSDIRLDMNPANAKADDNLIISAALWCARRTRTYTDSLKKK